MTLAKIMLLVCGVLFSATAWADQASEAAAEKLFQSIDMQLAMDKIIDVTLGAEIAQKPEIAPYKNVMRAFFTKYMSYEALKPQLVAVYASEFTATELTEAADFYSTPTGQKLLSKLPALIAKGAEIGTQTVNDHLPELEEVVRVEAKRLQELPRESGRP